MELGYRTVYITIDEMRRSPYKLRCILCCCPCCFGGLIRSLQEFHHSGAVWSFTFWITLLDVAVFLAELALGGFVSTADNPMLGPSVCLLLRMQVKSLRGRAWLLVSVPELVALRVPGIAGCGPGSAGQADP